VHYFVKSQINRFHFFAIWVALCLSPLAHGAVTLTTNSDVATAGYYQLEWGDGDGADFTLQESQHPSFNDPKTLYQGPDTARLVSGRADGDYFYRVGVVDDTGQQTWSDVVHVEVKHHTLSRALIFFAIGGIVFLATLGAIVYGNKTTSTKE
jgi:hypothetical protein